MFDLNDLADALNSKINLEKAEASYGLTREVAEQRLLEVGLN